MTEADCLAYCKERGYDWGGLYEKFPNVVVEGGEFQPRIAEQDHIHGHLFLQHSEEHGGRVLPA